jgi:histidinol-phosphatase
VIPPLEDLRRAAVELAREAGKLTLRHFGSRLSPDRKDDGTPVTVADREAEALLRKRIRERFPGHGILGEEEGEEPGDLPLRWILDPIDGTRSFMRGVPLYTVLIGIEIEGEPSVGVIHCPALDETVSAAAGSGCHWRRSVPAALEGPGQASDVDGLSDAVALLTDLEAVLESPVGAGWRRLAGQARFSRGWGDAYGHLLVATGRAEIMVDPELASWDAAPLLPIVREAGGRFTDLEGRETIHGGSGISTNGRLHREVLKILSEQAGG